MRRTSRQLRQRQRRRRALRRRRRREKNLDLAEEIETRDKELKIRHRPTKRR